VKARRQKRIRTPPRDDVTPDELAKHVEQLHGVPARFVEAVEVKETHEGAIVWEGAVKVFDLAGHALAKQAYAWSYPTTATKRRFIAVLAVPPIDSPRKAVQAAILADVRNATKAREN
jgi:hypothetical protein